MSYKVIRNNKVCIRTLNEFVLNQNYIYHNIDLDITSYTNLLDNICSFEQMLYSKSIYFIATDESGNIIGTIRSLLWDNNTKLPIETIFNIDIRSYFRELSKLKLWHIGRFAIEKKVNSITLLKKLILEGIGPIVAQKSLGAVAECDEKLLKVLDMLGIEPTIITSSKEYLGSKTIPVFFSYETLYQFYIRNHFSN